MIRLRVYKSCCKKRYKKGNMAGLAEHLAKKIGGDPGFFTKCMGTEEVSGYSEDVAKAICARAHIMVTGHTPSQDADRKSKKTTQKQ